MARPVQPAAHQPILLPRYFAYFNCGVNLCGLLKVKQQPVSSSPAFPAVTSLGWSCRMLLVLAADVNLTGKNRRKWRLEYKADQRNGFTILLNVPPAGKEAKL